MYNRQRYAPTPQSLWSGRTHAESKPQYWYERVLCASEAIPDHPSPNVVPALIGYAGDTGVKRNGGRPGAKGGPDAIRKLMAGMAFHLPESLKIYDLGNHFCSDDDLEQTQSTIRTHQADLLQQHFFPIWLGGGHDLAYPHAMGILDYLQATKPGARLGIVNFDAHFDLRPYEISHSGSPFLQVLEGYDHAGYLALGIQRAATPPLLYSIASELAVKFVEAQHMVESRLDYLRQQLHTFIAAHDFIYLSIDLDGFSSAYAPGVSAPSPMGFSPSVAFPLFEQIASSGKLISMDVVELNPLYDQDNATARLAARCVEHIVNQLFS
jgi:formiminoglutamase